MTNERSLDIVVVGLGSVGRALIRQLMTVADRLESDYGIGFRMVGLADRSGLLHRGEGLSDSVIEEVLEAKVQGESIRDIQSAIPPISSLADLATDNTLFVDATAATGMASVWRDVLEADAGVVLANKLPLCEAWSESGSLFDHPHLRYEATVGAGLPVLSTLRTLLETGDSIGRIDGTLSGTLGFLTERMSEGVAFSAALVEAVDSRYAEPDPSEDLSGRDVARKAVILSRSAGLPVELSDVALEGFVPDAQLAAIATGNIGSSIDDALKTRFEDAARDGGVLRYLAQVSPDGIRVGLVRIPSSDSFASISGLESRVAFHTRRYAPYPLAICGSGAGSDVTAAGVLGDLFELAKKHGVKGVCL